ncbi:HlyD family type I secretion periplasmic adaptor subunit [Rhodoblastus acidophilus]|jgi:hemolysin D|uniref:Membrane fusion protein (MFP) family protein n=1 Tax=Rhodoblastus acidophilus TaxID=1074 RepID=A0A6N8DRH2_RHOAC|nr:HlyD family type I secretion periplasmic adaptor subunit [Rhodoblastus acidophilus]MCW2275179.1 hemolysin D [Rhodoblastus acidophilus]MTV32145.1 HlyD family type I secretion periplasmic adaptor subunit [Rhodoblastus acidophilus]
MTSASQKIVPFPARKTPQRTAQDIAFLPAALEITETPPSPVGRAVGATIVVIFCFALIWATFGQVDIVATANGKIVPSGRTKLVQPLEAGVVSAIHVRDGQRVKANEILIELDPTTTGAELEHLRGDLVSAQLDVARLRAALTWLEQPERTPAELFTPPAGATPQQIETQRQFLTSETSEQAAKRAELMRQEAQKAAERATVDAQIAKIEATIPVLQERVDVRKVLYDKALGSKLVYLTEYQDLVGMKHDAEVQRRRLREADTAIAALREARARNEAEYRHAVYADLAKAEQRAAGFAQDALKAERRAGLQKLLAPVGGVVQQLAVHTVGGVVSPAETLAVIVPDGDAVEIEATLGNRDVGFVHAGQDAAIKVETFNFTRYGLLHGVVANVSQDAAPQAKSGEARQAQGGEKQAPSLDYVARIALDRPEMRIDGKATPLRSGMAVTVEIRTGSRRIISYLLSPLEKAGQEALRER